MRILLAEDDKPLRTSLVRGLREQKYVVEQAATGVQAMSVSASGDFDAIILDVLLPGASGIAVCRTIRERGSRVPILMLTALDAVESRIAGLDAGADDYLVKPFDFGELLARLRALIRRRGEVMSTQLVIGDLVIDIARHTVRRGTRDIALTAKEFAFLAYLARNADRAVSRAELLSHVWDETKPSFSNIIDVCASRLRRKIDEGEPVALFTTLRGTGFLLSAPPTAAGVATPVKRATRRG